MSPENSAVQCAHRISMNFGGLKFDYRFARLDGNPHQTQLASPREAVALRLGLLLELRQASLS